RESRHAARVLAARRGGIGNEILEAAADPLVTGRRSVRDVAGNVLQGERLRLQAAHRGVERVEDTHNILSKSGSTAGPGLQPMAAIGKHCRKRHARTEISAFSGA